MDEVHDVWAYCQVLRVTFSPEDGIAKSPCQFILPASETSEIAQVIQTTTRASKTRELDVVIAKCLLRMSMRMSVLCRETTNLTTCYR